MFRLLPETNIVKALLLSTQNVTDIAAQLLNSLVEIMNALGSWL